jgi:hypothetical protein
MQRAMIPADVGSGKGKGTGKGTFREKNAEFET